MALRLTLTADGGGPAQFPWFALRPALAPIDKTSSMLMAGRSVEPPAGHSFWWSVVKVVVVLGAAALAGLLLAEQLPSFAELWSALTRADWWWVAGAIGLQAWSIGLVSHQQRRLLRAFGVPVPAARMQAITYASGAVALTVPAGAVVSGGYAYGQYRAAGAGGPVSAAVLVLSGLLSTIGLVAAGGSAFAAAGLVELWNGHPLAVVLIALIGLACIVVAAHRLGVRQGRQVDPPGSVRSVHLLSLRHPRAATIIRQIFDILRQTRQIPGRDLRDIVAASVIKWLLDAACLVAGCRAFGLDIGVGALTLLYLGVQVVRQIPFTPGGAGLVEAALLAGLVAAGAPPAPAAAAVLVYRLASAWAVIPVGFAALAVLRRPAWRTHPVLEPVGGAAGG